uniref:CD80-like immunoglobulin C2-set domain-containing protein n=1 Tax=Leptobrachium leishanense TaxID=445787 RepID=A0A8C5LP55_9ANUR
PTLGIDTVTCQRPSNPPLRGFTQTQSCRLDPELGDRDDPLGVKAVSCKSCCKDGQAREVDSVAQGPNTLITMTWKIRPLYKPPCIISITTDTRFFNNCSERTILENLSLRILKTQITDTGNYNCEMLNADRIFQTDFMLHVLVRPSVSLIINPAGFPVCSAVNGIPAAEISWIPKSDNVTTRRELSPDTTWTVISTYRAQIIPGREVTCNVSHPTFTHPQILHNLSGGPIRGSH